MPIVVSTVVVVLLGAGLAWRRRPALHWRLMTAAGTLDIGLVLYLVAARNALGTATRAAHPVLLAHIAVSIIALGLWVAMLRLGWLVLHGRRDLRDRHRRVAWIFVPLRLINYGTALLLPALLASGAATGGR